MAMTPFRWYVGIPILRSSQELAKPKLERCTGQYLQMHSQYRASPLIHIRIRNPHSSTLIRLRSSRHKMSTRDSRNFNKYANARTVFIFLQNKTVASS